MELTVLDVVATLDSENKVAPTETRHMSHENVSQRLEIPGPQIARFTRFVEICFNNSFGRVSVELSFTDRGHEGRETSA